MSDAQKRSSALDGAPVVSSQFSADLNAGFAFFLDCVVNLFLLSGLLIGVFDFPRDVLFERIIPGAIVGIVVGNALCVWYARKTVRETGVETHTSIPVGIDLPTLFAMVFFIIGPTYSSNLEALGAEVAAMEAWMVGVAGTVWIGVAKLLLSFLSRAMEQHLPRSSLIGAMAGIATVWLGAEAYLGILVLPEVGLVALLIMAFSLISGHRLPYGLPGAILAILAGTILYYGFAVAGVGEGYVLKAVPDLVPAIPLPTTAGFDGLFGSASSYLGVLLPLAILIAASSVNVVAGARIIGDTYDPQTVVRLDSAATLISALFGGVVQTTPYFGHTTYKRMGARTHYAIGVATVVAVGGGLGIIALASQLIPEAVLKPILMVVACDIMRLSFSSTDARHAPAVLFSLVPAILNYAFTKVDDLYNRVGAATVEAAMGARFMAWNEGYILLGTLSRGYILTSMILGALFVWIIDGKLKRASAISAIAAILTLFGVIHSVLPSAGMYLPWALPDLGGTELWAWRLALGYSILSALLLALNAVARPAELGTEPAAREDA